MGRGGKGFKGDGEGIKGFRGLRRRQTNERQSISDSFGGGGGLGREA